MKTPSPIGITEGYPIRRHSPYGSPFFVIEIDISDASKESALILSGSSSPQGPIIFDDLLRVNGMDFQPGFSGNPEWEQYLGKDPSITYGTVGPIDITAARGDSGLLRIELHDRGAAYCCSAIYLHIVEKPAEQGADDRLPGRVESKAK